MKRLIKKHIGFMTAIAVSVIIVLVLLVFVLIQNGEMLKAAKDLQGQKSKIEQLNSAKPSPAEENYDNLLADAAKYKEKVEILYQHFGRPYERALNSFCEVLGIESDDFRSLFRSYWEDGISRNQQGDQIYALFVESNGNIEGAPEREIENEDGSVTTVKVCTWDRAKWNRAMEAFVKEASKYTLEDIGNADSASAKELLLASLGVPRNFGGNGARCKAYVNSTKKKLIDVFIENNVGLSKDAQNFSFVYTGSGEPAPADIVKISKVWDIVCDLCQRIAKSDIGSLETFSIDSIDGIEGSDGFRYYRFQIEVSGTLDEIRNLTEVLADAYVDSRVYIVRRMALMKDFDAAQILIDENINKSISETNENAAAGAVAVQPARRTTGSVGVSSDGRSSALSIRRGSIEDVSWANPTIYEEGRTFIEEVMKVEESEEKIAAGMRRNYGRPVIGVGDRCTASIVVDYVAYETDELETE